MDAPAHHNDAPPQYARDGIANPTAQPDHDVYLFFSTMSSTHYSWLSLTFPPVLLEFVFPVTCLLAMGFFLALAVYWIRTVWIA
ncbi:hypothetical protein BU26DRAFT_521132 [Trematosphaeria pertusa]|uniref:Uncharacterized protein n=1 Tax=Trematosphaeria pertusa TaxID=390896 RepID=A0A6A6I9D5_9PLEO|nr:uncharacterized protein BU26DRAFT_521132 [Trematosphaeria pertusa]KAF2246688.1 hypothetical protein BU26DRAFT_521132 [Trematosphaeria pertusa]